MVPAPLEMELVAALAEVTEIEPDASAVVARLGGAVSIDMAAARQAPVDPGPACCDRGDFAGDFDFGTAFFHFAGDLGVTAGGADRPLQSGGSWSSIRSVGPVGSAVGPNSPP